jgi:hypothetical protein
LPARQLNMHLADVYVRLIGAREQKRGQALSCEAVEVANLRLAILEGALPGVACGEEQICEAQTGRLHVVLKGFSGPSLRQKQMQLGYGREAVLIIYSARIHELCETGTRLRLARPPIEPERQQRLARAGAQMACGQNITTTSREVVVDRLVANGAALHPTSSSASADSVMIFIALSCLYLFG